MSGMPENNKSKTNQKLKRSRILKTWPEYNKILCQGGRVENKRIALSFSSKSGKSPRVGILVAKRLGKAVKRNRVKRLLKEGYRLNQALFSSAGDMVIKAKKDISQLTFREIETDLVMLGKAIKDIQGRPTVEQDS